MARRDDTEGGTRTGRNEYPPSRTESGAEATSRTAGSGRHGDDEGRTLHDADRTDTDRTDTARTGTTTETVETQDEYESRVKPAKYMSAKTSAAAAFALVFGLAALFCALTAILSPAAVLFGIIGIILGIVGIKKAKLPGVTGKGVAIGGLVTAVLGLLLGGAVIAGAAAFASDEGRLGELRTQIDELINSAPSGSEVVDQVPGG